MRDSIAAILNRRSPNLCRSAPEQSASGIEPQEQKFLVPTVVPTILKPKLQPLNSNSYKSI